MQRSVKFAERMRVIPYDNKFLYHPKGGRSKFMKRKLAAIFASAVSAISGSAFFAMNAFAEEAAGAAASDAPANAGGGLMTFVLPLVLMFVLLYFMAIRPQKKRDQEAQQMQNSLQVGDEIVTRDGIVGMIFRIGDDTVVIETGGERHKLRIKKWAIAENVTAAEKAKAAQAQAKAKKGLASAAVTDDGGESEKKKSKKSKNSEEAESSEE